MWKKIIILSLTIIACFMALHYTSINYSDVLSKSNVEIPIQNLTKNLRIKDEPPYGLPFLILLFLLIKL